MRQSWIDRIAGPEGRLQRWWLWLPVTWVGTTMVLQVPLWLDGTMAFPELDRYAVVDPFYLVAPLAGYGYLTRVARVSFDHFRAVLGSGVDAELERSRLSSLPTGVATLALLLGGVVGVVAYVTDSGRAGTDPSPVSASLWILVGFLSFGLHVVLATLIVRQLRRVARLHSRAEGIDLYEPAPLHAFARLTARAGVVVLGLAMYSAATDPTTFTNPLWRTVFLVAMTLAAAAFFFPLGGLARRLRAEKHSLLSASTARTSKLTATINAAIDRGDFAAVGEPRRALGALDEEQGRIRKMSAWPWETGTIRGFATTLLIPITTWLLTNLLGNALGL